MKATRCGYLGKTGWCGVASAALLLALAAGVMLAAGCSRSPPEARLRDRIASMQAALEARNPKAFVAGVAEDFSGDSNLDREGVRNLLRAQLLRNQRIGATLGPLDVQLHGERATVRFKVMLTGGSGGLLPDSARGWQVDSGWRDGPEDWQLIHASWQPVL